MKGIVFSVPWQARRKRSRLCPTRPLSRLIAQLAQAFHLAGVSDRIHLDQRDGERLFVLVLVHPHNNADMFVNFALVSIGRIRKSRFGKIPGQ